MKCASFLLFMFCFEAGAVDFRVTNHPLPGVQSVDPATARLQFRGQYTVRALCEVLSGLTGKPYSLLESGNEKLYVYGSLDRGSKEGVVALIESLGYCVTDGEIVSVRPCKVSHDSTPEAVFFVFRPVHRRASELVKLVSSCAGETPPATVRPSPAALPGGTASLPASEGADSFRAVPGVLYVPDDASGSVFVRCGRGQEIEELDKLVKLDRPVNEFEVSFRVVEISETDTRQFRMGITNSFFSIGQSISLDATIKNVLKGDVFNWQNTKIQFSNNRLRGRIHGRESLDFRCRSGDEVDLFSGQSIAYVSQSSDYQPAVGTAQKVTKVSTANIGQNLKFALSGRSAGGYFYRFGVSSTRQTGTVTLDGNPVPNTADLRHSFSGVGIYGSACVVADIARSVSNLSKSDPGLPLLSWFGSTERGWSDSRILFVILVQST